MAFLHENVAQVLGKEIERRAILLALGLKAHQRSGHDSIPARRD
jgi:hypothetical protein